MWGCNRFELGWNKTLLNLCSMQMSKHFFEISKSWLKSSRVELHFVEQHVALVVCCECQMAWQCSWLLHNSQMPSCMQTCQSTCLDVCASLQYTVCAKLKIQIPLLTIDPELAITEDICMEFFPEHRSSSDLLFSCGDLPHQCGQPCVLSSKDGCLHKYCKVVIYPMSQMAHLTCYTAQQPWQGCEHLCAAWTHACGAPCSLQVDRQPLCMCTCVTDWYASKFTMSPNWPMPPATRTTITTAVL